MQDVETEFYNHFYNIKVLVNIDLLLLNTKHFTEIVIPFDSGWIKIRLFL